MKWALFALLLVGTFAIDYDFDHLVTLKKDSLDLNHWESSELESPGWLRYNISSLDRSSKFSVIALNNENLVKYENGDPYYAYTEYTQYNVKNAVLNRSFIDLGKNFYIVIENENLLSEITVDVLINYHRELNPASIDLEITVKALFGLLVTLAIIGVGVLIYFVVIRRKRGTYLMIAEEPISKEPVTETTRF